MTDALPVELFDYDLPPSLIAQQPAEPRDASRLLVVHRATGALEHARFREIGRWLRAGDLLVVNRSRVVPARLAARRRPGGGHAEILLLRRIDAGLWEALVRPGRKLGPGDRVDLADGIVGEVVDRTPAGGRLIRFHLPGDIEARAAVAADADGRSAASAHASAIPGSPAPRPAGPSTCATTPADAGASRSRSACAKSGPTTRAAAPTGTGDPRHGTGAADADTALLALGSLPLPPYITEYRGDPERYQTVYSDRPGSAAAPTAGLHFTPDLLASLREQGIGLATVTLHVGLDTFRPVKADDLRQHAIHRETCALPEETARAIAEARARGGRVVAVGTTTVRTLESAARAAGPGPLVAWSGETDLFIVPGYRFRVVDALVTNFHQPRSTLLALVSAFASRDLVMAAYAEAIRTGYRFFSFGDATLIL